MPTSIASNNGGPTHGSRLDRDLDPITRATLHGSRMALRRTSIVPLVMSAGYLLLILHFRSIGGYRQIAPDDETAGTTTHAVVIGD